MALDRLDGLLAKLEVTYGLDPTPVAADDGVRVMERVWENAGPTHAFENLRPDAPSGTLFPLPPATPRGRMVEFTITWDARGAGAAYSATVLPEGDPLLQASGLARVDDFTVSAETVTYSPADTGHKSCTVWAYAGGVLFKIVGVRCRLRIPISAGGFSRFVFDCSGIMVLDPATIALPSITYDSTVSPPGVNMALDVGGGTWIPDSFQLDLDGGQQIERLDGVNETEGIQEFAIIGFDDASMAIQARTTLLATYDPYADMRNRTARAIAIQAGTVQYNKWDIAIAAGYAKDPTHSVDSGVVAWTVDYQLLDYAIKFD